MIEQEKVEQDVIGHLIEIERIATELQLEAESKADAQKALAKEKAEQMYRTFYGQLLEKLDADLASDKLTCDKSRDSDYAAYEAYLKSTKIDQTSFDAYLNTIFFGQ